MPVTCMPSPESPANRITTVSRASMRFGFVAPLSGILDRPPGAQARTSRPLPVPMAGYSRRLSATQKGRNDSGISVDPAQSLGLWLALLRIVTEAEADPGARCDALGAVL